MKRAVLILGVLVALGSSLASSAMGADAAPLAAERVQALDRQVLAALNRTRADHGLRPVVVSSDLQAAAFAHSKAMLSQGFFAHDSPSGVPFKERVRGFYRSTGYDTWAAGENLIYSTRGLTAARAIAAWMASPTHRENMLTPEWREVGIGSLRARSAGGIFAGEATWVITMDFGARSGKPVTRQVSSRKPAPKRSSKPVVAKPTKKPATKPKPIARVLPQPISHPVEADAFGGSGRLLAS